MVRKSGCLLRSRSLRAAVSTALPILIVAGFTGYRWEFPAAERSQLAVYRCMDRSGESPDGPDAPAAARRSGLAVPSGEQCHSPAAARRLALLIGCSRYPALPANLQLQGPGNDVAITAELLRSERFGIDPRDLIALVSGAGDINEPTAGNIVAAFEGLCAQAGPGDDIFILMAGHGCQVPNRNPESDPEPDGLDEAFVPADISRWESGSPPPENELILDDQISLWLERMTAAGARVFLVADCCHAGEINRGPGEPESWARTRRLPPIFRAADAEPDLAADDFPATATNDWECPSGIVSLFAVPSRWSAVEDRMPPGSPGGPEGVHGRLSFALNQTLRQARRPLTYRELLQQLNWHYAGWGWNPRPYLSGDRLDLEILGRREWPERSLAAATRESRQYRLNVGFLDQIAPGSIFALYPPTGAPNEDQPITYLRVTGVTAGECVALPVEYSRTPVPDSLPLGGRAELVYLELGDARLPVDILVTAGVEVAPDVVSRYRQTLNSIMSDPRSLVRSPRSDEPPELFLEIGPDSAVLKRALGAVPGFVDSGSAAFGPFHVSDRLEQDLAASLRMISRAINLVRIAAPHGPATAGQAGENGPKLEIKVQIAEPRGARTAEHFVPVDPLAELHLCDGDRIRVIVTNRSPVRVDVTGLVVESGFAINPLRLRSESGQELGGRLEPDGGSGQFWIRINAATTGVDHLVIIAVPSSASPQPVSFRYLEQRDLAQALAARPDQDRSAPVRGRFQQLLDASLFDGAASRGPASDDESGLILRIPWTVVPPTPVPHPEFDDQNPAGSPSCAGHAMEPQRIKAASREPYKHLWSRYCTHGRHKPA